MHKIFLIFIILLINNLCDAQLLKQTVRTSELGCIVWLPHNFNPANKYPLWIYAHGAGQKTNIPPDQTLNNMYDDGIPKALFNGFIPPYDFIMVAPQDSLYSVNPAYVRYIIHEAKLRWNIDTTQIVLAGFSAGGWMTHGLLVSTDTSTAKLISCVVQVSGVCYPPRVDTSFNSIKNIQISKVPILEIIGTADSSIGYDREVRFINSLNNALPGVATLVSRVNIGHTDFGIWDTSYMRTDTATHNRINPYVWAHQHPLGSYNSSQQLVIIANAGPNQTITMPQNQVTVNGSGSSNKGPIISYLWTKVSGGVSDVIVSPNNASTVIKDLSPGVWIYQLKITDSSGNFATSSVTITVNAAAGAIITVQAEQFTGGFNHTSIQTGGTGQIVGIIAPGQLDFSSATLVNIPSSGTYTFKAHYATPNLGGTMQLKNSSGSILGSASIISTDRWTIYQDLTFTVSLIAGLQKLSVAAVGATFNLDYFTLQKVGEADFDKIQYNNAITLLH